MLYFLLLGWLKAVLERLLIKPFLEMIKTDAVFYCETSCLGTAEGGKVGATIESPADITGEGADVSAFAANHTDAGGLLLIVIIGEFYLVYTHGLRLELNLFACPAQGIRAVAIHLYGTVGRRNLLNLAHKLLKRFLHQLAGDMLRRIGVIHAVFLIVAGGSSTELQGSCILLGVGLQLFYLLGTFTGAEHQHASGKGIERTGMSYLHLKTELLAEQIANMCQGSETRHAIRLVDGNNFSFSEIHSVCLVNHLHIYTAKAADDNDKSYYDTVPAESCKTVLGDIIDEKLDGENGNDECHH